MRLSRALMAVQTGSPDDGDLAAAAAAAATTTTTDDGARARARRFPMRGDGDEWWCDRRGSRGDVSARPATLHGAARNIAAGPQRGIGWCALAGTGRDRARRPRRGHQPRAVRSGGGMIIEECNHYRDPCMGPHGDATPYLRRDKPVLDAESTDDGEMAARFCARDVRAQITGAHVDVGLDGRFHEPCPPPDSPTGRGRR